MYCRHANDAGPHRHAEQHNLRRCKQRNQQEGPANIIHSDGSLMLDNEC